MSEGYIYTMPNSTMAPDTYKVGFTEKLPTERLKEANSSTFALPHFKLEFAKKVTDPRDKEQKLHRALTSFGKRIHPKREFFVVPLKNIRVLFDMIDGEIWDESSTEPIISPFVDETKSNVVKSFPKGRLDAFKKVEHIELITGQLIRHALKSNGNVWTGRYDVDKGVTCDSGEKYTSLSSFALAHNRTINPSRQTTDGWGECEALVDGVWIPTKKP